MSCALLGAGRNTHLKIVSLSLAGTIVVVLVSLNARSTDSERGSFSAVVKAVAPATYARQGSSTIR
jgi:hypothetical protein